MINRNSRKLLNPVFQSRGANNEQETGGGRKLREREGERGRGGDSRRKR